MATWIYVCLVLAVIAVPLALAIYAWWVTPAPPSVKATDDPELSRQRSATTASTSLAEPEVAEVALRVERDP